MITGISSWYTSAHFQPQMSSVQKYKMTEMMNLHCGKMFSAPEEAPKQPEPAPVQEEPQVCMADDNLVLRHVFP